MEKKKKKRLPIDTVASKKSFDVLRERIQEKNCIKNFSDILTTMIKKFVSRVHSFVDIKALNLTEEI